MGREIYELRSTRPLSIVNTDNRILAATVKVGVEKEANRWVSQAQQGFIPGRSMNANILEVEKEAREIRKKGGKGAIILFDFAAAFPSVDQWFLMEALEGIKCEEKWLKVIKKFYVGNLQKIGEATPFMASTGQGDCLASCGQLLHGAASVTRGRRYVLIVFIDDSAFDGIQVPAQSAKLMPRITFNHIDLLMCSTIL